MSSKEYAVQEGGLITFTTFILFVFSALAFAIVAVRFFTGLGAVTNMNDGYPWGVWLAYDLAVGTAFASGGFVLALVSYIFNGWKYHPLMRSAIVASMFGYGLAGFSVIIDIGRYWNIYGFFMPSRINPASIMLMVALCAMAYVTILILEFLPSVLERLKEGQPSSLQRFALWAGPKLDKVLFIFIALGLTIPFMQQSSYGALWMIIGDKLNPLWQTPFLPLLFFLGAPLMGAAVILFEAGLSSVGFDRPFEYEALDLSRIIPFISIVWLAVRFGDLIWRGQIGALFTSGFHSVMVWLELGTIIIATIVFLTKPGPRKAFYAAILLCFGAGLYRMNVYLIGYDPGPEWYAYFPSVKEFLVTFGFVMFEVLGYIVFARLLRILPVPHAKH